ncbi:carboxymuconolactone decarboxylase family protein [Burkholderia cepacia]|uniref:carboxymuconolactone decarboxylase family protein n=1 Tax=Burkholderia TaxID=32008 RepID=UPI0030CA354A
MWAELMEYTPMRMFVVAILSLALGTSACSQLERKPEMTSLDRSTSATSFAAMSNVSPALEHYTNAVVLGDLWKRPQLSARNRSVVTLSVLIARNQSTELPFYLDLALDSGLRPSEISEIIAHLAFYSGWANATAAAQVTSAVFQRRGITVEQLPPATVEMLPLDKAAEAQRESTVQQNFGLVSPGVVQFTRDTLFNDLWLRPGLAPRDRSLVTVSALVATGQVAQLTYHLNRAMDNGLTAEQASEVMTQLAFYAGWPNVFTALPVVKDVLARRPG